MKNINSFNLNSLNNCNLKKVDESIYTNGEEYFLGLSFEQEPEFDEGSSSAEISQYPLEDILDKFGVSVYDFCEDENSNDIIQCKLVFSSKSVDRIKALKTIIGRHVYNFSIEDQGEEYIDLIIE